MIRAEDVMGWTLVVCVVLGVLSTLTWAFSPKPSIHYLCTDNEVYSKRQGETFWRKENVQCLTEDKT